MGAPADSILELPPPLNARRRKYHIVPAMAMKNAPPRPTPTPIPTFACGCKPPVSLLESDDDAVVEMAVDGSNEDTGVGNDDEEREEVVVAVVASPSDVKVMVGEQV